MVFMTNTLISLIGPMGAGKTTVGKALEKRLGFDFVDSDQQIQANTGVSISNIFAIEGEAGFREREAQMITTLVHRKNTVLATGGGVVLVEANRVALRSHTIVVYLRALPEDVWARIRHDKTRPLLQTADPLETLRQMFAIRDPLYSQCAHITIDNRRKNCNRTLQNIMAQLVAMEHL